MSPLLLNDKKDEHFTIWRYGNAEYVLLNCAIPGTMSQPARSAIAVLDPDRGERPGEHSIEDRRSPTSTHTGHPCLHTGATILACILDIR